MGNGLSVRVFADCWLPTQLSLKVTSTDLFLEHSHMVGDLIDPKLGLSKENVVRYHFNNRDAEIILSIPLLPSLPCDVSKWKYS